jgi:hypothetical protein
VPGKESRQVDAAAAVRPLPMQSGETPAGDLTPREKILLAEYAEVCKSNAGITDFRAKLLALLLSPQAPSPRMRRACSGCCSRLDLLACDAVTARRRPERPKQLLDMVLHRRLEAAGRGARRASRGSNDEEDFAPNLFECEDCEVVGKVREVVAKELRRVDQVVRVRLRGFDGSRRLSADRGVSVA